jgi:plastocyanin
LCHVAARRVGLQRRRQHRSRHNVTFIIVNGRPADISGSNANTTIARTFATAGTFGYVCTLHAGMTGTVIVQ